MKSPNSLTEEKSRTELLNGFVYRQTYLNHRKKNAAIKFIFDHSKVATKDLSLLPWRFHVTETGSIKLIGQNSSLPKDVRISEVRLPRLFLLEARERLLGLFGNKGNENDVLVLESTLKRFTENLMDIAQGKIDVFKFAKEHRIDIPGRSLEDNLVPIALFLRVHVIKLWYESETDLVTRHNLNLWLSTHMDLAIDIKKRGGKFIYYNSEEEDDCLPSLLKNYPHDARYLDANELLDTSCCLYRSTEKTPETNKSRDRSFMGLITHLVFTKTRPHTCQKRKIKEMIPQEMSKNKSLEKLFLDLIFISICGNYQWSNTRLNFRNMCYFKEMMETRFNVYDFIKDHEFLFIFIFREYVLFNIVHCPGYDKYLDSVEKNIHFKDFIIQTMDLIRLTLNRLFNEDLFFGDERLKKEIQTLETQIYSIFLTFGTKTDKQPPAIVFHKKIESMSRANQVVNPEELIGKRGVARIMTMIEWVLELGHVHFKCYFDVNKLKLLGLSAPVFFYFKFIWREFCETDAADNPLYKKLEPIMRQCPREFAVIRLYLQKLIDSWQRIRYILPKCYTDLQEFGFQKKMCFAPSKDKVRFSYLCLNCGNWANHVLKPRDPNAKKKMASYTPHECAQKLSNGDIVCLKTKNRGKPTNKSQSPNDAPKNRCSARELLRIDMIGVIQKNGHKLYCVCWKCNCLFELKAESYSNYGPICGNHDAQAMKKFSGNNNNLVKEKLRCFYCGNNVFNRSHNNPAIGEKIYVIDNTDYIVPGIRKFELREIGLCNLHYEQSKEVKRNSMFPFLSDVMDKLFEKSEMKIRRSSHKNH